VPLDQSLPTGESIPAVGAGKTAYAGAPGCRDRVVAVPWSMAVWWCRPVWSAAQPMPFPRSRRLSSQERGEKGRIESRLLIFRTLRKGEFGSLITEIYAGWALLVHTTSESLAI
jgi:hypothetical protein